MSHFAVTSSQMPIMTYPSLLPLNAVSRGLPSICCTEWVSGSTDILVSISNMCIRTPFHRSSIYCPAFLFLEQSKRRLFLLKFDLDIGPLTAQFLQTQFVLLLWWLLHLFNVREIPLLISPVRGIDRSILNAPELEFWRASPPGKDDGTRPGIPINRNPQGYSPFTSIWQWTCN